jgi:hypothetical protein
MNLMKFWVLAFVGCAALASTTAPQPNPTLTPGAICTASDPDFDGFRYPEHVAHCKRHVTAQMKREIGQAYGIDPTDFSSYEFDHLYPLGIGGSNAPQNIWPEPKEQADEKDKLENQLYQKLRRGTITQRETLRQIDAWVDSQR